MAEKRNIILFGAIIILTLSYWVSSAFFIGDKPFEIKLLEQEETCALRAMCIALRARGNLCT